MTQFNLYGASLIGYWPLYEGSGTAVHDISAAGNVAALVGTINWLSGTNCKFESCLNFTNVPPASRYAAVPSTFQLPVSGFTVAAWIYSAKNPSADSYYLGGVVGISGDGFYFGEGTSQQIFQTEVNAVGVYVVCTSTLTVNPGTWYFLTFTFNGTTQTTYINGQAKQCSYIGTPNALNTGFEFGDYAGIQAAAFNGSINNLEIWNVSLSQSAVSELYNSFFHI